MARGGYRPGAGRPRKKARVPAADAAPAAPVAVPEGATPLDYMLAVMRDPGADSARRDRMAIAAAPFVHAKAEAAPEGKKAQRQAVAEQTVAEGKFAVPDGPRLVVDNR